MAHSVAECHTGRKWLTRVQRTRSRMVLASRNNRRDTCPVDRYAIWECALSSLRSGVRNPIGEHRTGGWAANLPMRFLELSKRPAGVFNPHSDWNQEN